MPIDLIDLRWGGRPEFWAYRGHGLDAETLRADVRALYEEEDETAPTSLPVRERWARWVFDWPLPDGCVHSLRIYSQPSRGAFPVSIVTDGDEEARIAAARAAEADSVARATAAALARWPGIEVVKVTGGHTSARSSRLGEGVAHVDFRFPGGEGVVCWREGDTHVLVERRDVAAWNKWRGHEPEDVTDAD